MGDTFHTDSHVGGSKNHAQSQKDIDSGHTIYLNRMKPADFKCLKNIGLGHTIKFEPVHEISNNVVCATSKASYQPAHMCSLIRAFASRLGIL